MIEINILHWLWWICTGSGGRLRLCAACLCVIFCLYETNLWENASSGRAFWSGPARCALGSDQVHHVTRDVWFPSRLRLTAWHEGLSAWYLHVMVTRFPVSIVSFVYLILIVSEQWNCAAFIHRSYSSSVKEEKNESRRLSENFATFLWTTYVEREETILWHKLVVTANDSATAEKCHCCYHL